MPVRQSSSTSIQPKTRNFFADSERSIATGNGSDDAGTATAGRRPIRVRAVMTATTTKAVAPMRATITLAVSIFMMPRPAVIRRNLCSARGNQIARRVSVFQGGSRRAWSLRLRALTVPSPRRGEGWGEGVRRLKFELRAPSPDLLALLASRPLPTGERRMVFHAALPRSAIATSERKISVAPLRRSDGESHSSKNTTFMSGRTRAPAGCLAI